MPDDHTAAGRRRRTQILDTALDVLVTEGLDGFAMRAIATELEISLGNLQYYFPTRDDLLEAVIRDQFAKDLGVIETSRGDWARAFGDLIERWQGPTGAAFLSLSLLAGRSQQFATLHHDIYESFIDTLAGVIRGAVDLAEAVLDGDVAHPDGAVGRSYS